MHAIHVQPEIAMTDRLTVALAQIEPVWLDRAGTLAKVIEATEEAARQGAALVAFGESLVPGYPFWLERLDAARFQAKDLKEIHALYIDQAVCIERGDLAPLAALAARRKIAIVLGIIERPAHRGESVYASAVTINGKGEFASVHRKLMPTYEERLCWAPGDGHGLRTHPLGAFTVGSLNCWENWMPMARAALYAQGEDLHVAIWPGGEHNTRDLTRFIAREARSYVMSVSGLLRRDSLPANIPQRAAIVAKSGEFLANGGSCLSGPDGEWVIEPIVGRECVAIATLDHARVREERQSFDPSGHYARPDVLALHVNRQRQSTAYFSDEQG